MTARLAEAALPFVAWSRVFSPLAPETWREEAWLALALPGTFCEAESDFINAFVVGLPAPDVPLLLHAALGREGAAVREDWMRVMHHLGLRWNEKILPPDHLAVACDVMVCAIEREESFLIDELSRRYLEPWCTLASSRLTEKREAIAVLPERFAADLAPGPKTQLDPSDLPTSPNLRSTESESNRRHLLSVEPLHRPSRS